MVLQIYELNFISLLKHVSSLELHELLANKRVAKTDKFQFCMHPVTASLLNSVGGAGGRSCGWGRSKKIGVGQNKLWIENFIDNTQAAHANQAIYQTRLLQIKSQAVVNNPLARKNIFKTSISISTKIIQYVKSYLIKLHIFLCDLN